MYNFFCSLLNFLKNYMIIGCIAVVPIFFSFYIVFTGISFIDEFFSYYLPSYFNDYSIPGLGLFIVIGFFTLVGFIIVHILGKTVASLPYKIANNLPIVRSVYNTIEKIFIITMDKENKYFSKVVLVEYPRKEIWSIGLVTIERGGKIEQALNKEVCAVFVPTAPSPISGMIIYVSKDNIVPIDISIEEAFSIILSLGTLEVGPTDIENVRNDLSKSIQNINKKIGSNKKLNTKV